VDIALQYIKEEPHALQGVVKRFADKTDKRLSLSSLKHLTKKGRLRWQWVRKSLKSLPDPDAFAKAKRELVALQKQEDQGQIALYYFDESSFVLAPSIPYAWQESGSTFCLGTYLREHRQQKNSCRVNSMSTRQEVLSVRWELAPWRQGDFHTAVLRPALGGRIRGNRLTFAERLGPNVLPGHAVLCQVGSHRVCSPLP
jgi:hypothetical protein